MSTLPISSSSSSSSSSSATESSNSKRSISRRFSAPPIGDTAPNTTTSSVGSTFSTHVLYPPLPPLPAANTSLTSKTDLSIGVKPKHRYTIHYHYPATSSAKITPTGVSSDTHLLTAPLRRDRSNSEPRSPAPTATSTSSSSSSSSDAWVRELRREPKEDKDQERRLLRNPENNCYLQMQWADNYIQSKQPDDYLRRAIILYREVVKTQNTTKNPYVKPYFTLVKLLLQEADPGNNAEIMQILDSIIQGHFSVWERVNGYMKKAEIFKKSFDIDHITSAIECWKQVKLLAESQTSDEDEMTRIAYLKTCRSYIKEMKKKKQTIEHYTTVA